MMMLIMCEWMNFIISRWIMTAITCIYVHALLTAIFSMNLGHPAASVILFLPLFGKITCGMSGTGFYRLVALPSTQPSELKPRRQLKSIDLNQAVIYNVN